MNKLRLPFALAFLLSFAASTLLAQDPVPVLKITPPQNIAIGDLAVVEVDPTSNVQDVQLVVIPSPVNPANWQIRKDAGFLVCGADQPAGGLFTIIAAGNLNGATITATTTVTFGKPEPNPPPPPPGPSASHLWLILAYDTTAQNPQINSLISDSAYWYTVISAGHQFRFFDAGNAAAKPFVEAASKLGTATPFILFMDADTKKVLAVKSLPLDKAGVDAEIKALTGKSSEE